MNRNIRMTAALRGMTTAEYYADVRQKNAKRRNMSMYDYNKTVITEAAHSKNMTRTEYRRWVRERAARAHGMTYTQYNNWVSKFKPKFNMSADEYKSFSTLPKAERKKILKNM
jgi:Fe-S oxidoreductase